MEKLERGREGIFRESNTVLRPLQPWSATIHQVLAHLHRSGFDACPALVAVEQHLERLTFIEGNTYNYPLTGAIASHAALVSAAHMLRAFHDASASMIADLSGDEVWMLPPRAPAEVICHGDFSPYNVALKGEQVVGVFDFDTAHPAPRIWDLAYAIYCWAPFKTHHVDKLGTLDAQIERARVFCDAYGLSETDRRALPERMIERLKVLVEFITSGAEQGDETFGENISDGHHLAYLADINYINKNKENLRMRLVS